jgi:N-acetylmuramic acid 6-phosphate etherase
MTTEDVSARFVDLDAWGTREAIEAMLEGQMSAVAAVRPALSAIARAVEDAATALKVSGRLAYVGAGTSGRVAVQDGAELSPTFDWPMNRVTFVVAGGRDALVRSAEGAEDNAEEGARLIEALAIGTNDVVIGVAASGTTPFTVAAVDKARTRNAVTIGIANNPDVPLLAAARHPILLDTGSELIAGSTRMKAGTAQKIALNLISTGIMIKLGRIYHGMMVNMHVANSKLKRRAADMVVRITGCDESRATEALNVAAGDIKLAALIASGVDAQAARKLLETHQGSLRHAFSAAVRKG